MKNKEKHNKKKKYQISIRRLYFTNSPCKEITNYISLDKQEFIEHINKFLLDGMTKENFGNIWGFDHIVPVELFDLDNEEDLKKCYNFINIIPMFNNDNRIKGASIHFSLELLNNLLKKECFKDNKKTITFLINKCKEEINNRYNKYLL